MPVSSCKSLSIGEAYDVLLSIFTGQSDDPREARSKTQILLEDVTKLTPRELTQNKDQKLSPDQLGRFQEVKHRCEIMEPVQYITGKAYFRHIVLKVNRSVLIPRQETEMIVDIVKDYLRAVSLGKALMADIGCGSGAIGLSLAHEISDARIIVSDISKEALEVCMYNARELGLKARIDAKKGNLMEPFDEEAKLDVIVANLPYVSEREAVQISDGVKKFEPSTALFAGSDGLKVISEIIKTSPKYLKKGGLLVLEIGHNQSEKVTPLFNSDEWTEVKIIKDYAKIKRFVIARKAEKIAA